MPRRRHPDDPQANRRRDAVEVFEELPPVPAPAARVIVVVADRRVRRDLAGLIALGHDLAIVGTAADAMAAMSVVETEAPDLIVVDPRLPDVEVGLELVARLRRRSTARILVLCHDEALRGRALAVGADIFLTEGESPTAVLEAIVRIGASLDR